MVTAYGREEVDAQAEAAGRRRLPDQAGEPVGAAGHHRAALGRDGRRRTRAAARAGRPATSSIASPAGARVLWSRTTRSTSRWRGRLLERAGLVVDVADNGQEALEQAGASSASTPC